MPSPPTHPALHPDVNALLSTVLSGVQAIMGSQFAGMYIHGSIATGDFDPQRSDIDYLVVTRDPLPAGMVSALAAMHARIAASGLRWVSNYEGSYIPVAAIRRHDPAADSVYPAIRADGSFGLDRHGSEWVIQRHVIREHGIVLAGPPPATLIDPIPPNDLRRAVRRLLQEWWLPQVQDPFRLQSSEYQAYATLTMCRALYTLETGRIASKPQAGRWALQTLGDHEWVGLIETALAWRHGAEVDRLSEVLAFIRFTLERSQHFVLPPE